MKTAVPPTMLRTSPRIHYKNILFATDLGAASAQAQAYAALLASMFGAHLYVLHVDAGSGLSPRYRGRSAAAAEGSQADDPEMNEVDKFFQASGLPYTLLRERGEVPGALQRAVEERSIDLIIVGSHGRHGVPYLFMGSTAEEVTRMSPCPVITVGPAAEAGFENSLKTVLFATDFSEESKLALPYATALAQEFHANLAVLHVAPKTERLVRDRDHVERYLQNRLKNLAPQSRFPWCTVSHVVRFGDATEEILTAAKERNADLIVLGLHSAVRFTSHLPERLSYQVLCRASCPVFSILPSSRDIKLAQLPATFLAMASHMN
ncbi:MAG TPA: universal stress protein [Candidatus Angelobacter sp.]